MKKFLFFLFFSLSFQCLIAQNFDYTKTKITLKNEFGIPYQNAKIILSSSDTNYLVNINSNGEGIINIVQGVEFIVTSYINEEKYEFEELIFIGKNKNIYEASIDLQLDSYTKIFEIKNLNFESGKYNIQNQYYKNLENLVLLLKEEINIKIEIAGHTDSIGDNKTNLILSENRSKSVKSYLVTKGIDESRIKCVGYGENQPITNNSSIEGREKNRRIEIRILK
jgi:outer membrane protein OmpA-like peptidoglycan-associated protein